MTDQRMLELFRCARVTSCKLTRKACGKMWRAERSGTVEPNNIGMDQGWRGRCSGCDVGKVHAAGIVAESAPIATLSIPPEAASAEHPIPARKCITCGRVLPRVRGTIRNYCDQYCRVLAGDMLHAMEEAEERRQRAG